MPPQYQINNVGIFALAAAPPPPSGAPAWYTAATSGQWTDLGANSILDTAAAKWTGTNPGGVTGVKAVTDAWGGGILNTVGVYIPGTGFTAGVFWIIWGGGHNDYAGNEIYCYGPLDHDNITRQWRRLTDPSIPTTKGVAYYADGRPSARHTYANLTYDPDRNRMISMGASVTYSDSGTSFPNIDEFNFAVNPAGTPYSSPGSITYGGAFVNIEGMACYNPTTRKVSWTGIDNGTYLNIYDTVAGTISVYGQNNPIYQGGRAPAVSPLSNVMVWVGNVPAEGSGNSIYCYDLRSPSNARYGPSTTGTGPSDTCSLDWDPHNNRFVGYAEEGKTWYTLTPGANPYNGGNSWAWAQINPSGGVTPASNPDAAVHNRFRVAPNPIPGLFYHTGVLGRLYFYKF